jgi:hypothetical protein
MIRLKRANVKVRPQDGLGPIPRCGNESVSDKNGPWLIPRCTCECVTGKSVLGPPPMYVSAELMG